MRFAILNAPNCTNAFVRGISTLGRVACIVVDDYIQLLSPQDVDGIVGRDADVILL